MLSSGLQLIAPLLWGACTSVTSFTTCRCKGAYGSRVLLILALISRRFSTDASRLMRACVQCNTFWQTRQQVAARCSRQQTLTSVQQAGIDMLESEHGLWSRDKHPCRACSCSSHAVCLRSKLKSTHLWSCSTGRKRSQHARRCGMMHHDCLRATPEQEHKHHFVIDVLRYSVKAHGERWGTLQLQAAVRCKNNIAPLLR